MPTPYWTRSCIAYARLALGPSVWSPVIFPPRHMLISPAPVCCTSCILSLCVTALPCALLAPMDRCVIYCEPRGSTKKSTDSIALRRWTVYYGPIVEGASCRAAADSNRSDQTSMLGQGDCQMPTDKQTDEARAGAGTIRR